VALGLGLHLLEFQQRGLGGSQSHAWQPRQGRGDAGAQPAPVEAAPAPGSAGVQLEPA